MEPYVHMYACLTQESWGIWFGPVLLWFPCKSNRKLMMNSTLVLQAIHMYWGKVEGPWTVHLTHWSIGIMYVARSLWTAEGGKGACSYGTLEIQIAYALPCLNKIDDIMLAWNEKKCLLYAINSSHKKVLASGLTSNSQVWFERRRLHGQLLSGGRWDL